MIGRIGIIFGTLAVFSHAAPVQLTNLDGKTITVELVKADEREVWFKMTNQREPIAYERVKLTEASLKIIDDWVDAGGATSTSFEVNVTTGKSNRMNDDNDIDDRRYKIEPKLTIENEDRMAKTAALKATIVFFGKPVLHRGETCAVHRQQFDVEPIAPLGSVELNGEVANFKYDDVDNGEVYGARYRGYALMLQTADGEVVHSKGVPSSLEGISAELLENMAIGMSYDKDWQPTKNKIRLR